MIATRHLPFAVFRHVVLAAGAVVMLAPFIWLLSLAVKPADEIFTTDIRLLPLKWDAERNFTEAFNKVPLHRYLLNGVIVTAAIFTCRSWSPCPRPTRWPSCASASPSRCSPWSCWDC